MAQKYIMTGKFCHTVKIRRQCDPLWQNFASFVKVFGNFGGFFVFGNYLNLLFIFRQIHPKNLYYLVIIIILTDYIML